MVRKLTLSGTMHLEARYLAGSTQCDEAGRNPSISPMQPPLHHSHLTPQQGSGMSWYQLIYQVGPVGARLWVEDRWLGFAGSWEKGKAKLRAKHGPLGVHYRKPWVTGGQGVGLSNLGDVSPPGQRRGFAHLCASCGPHTRGVVSPSFSVIYPFRKWTTSIRNSQRDRVTGRARPQESWHNHPPFCTQEYFSILCLDTHMLNPAPLPSCETIHTWITVRELYPLKKL